MSVIFVFQTIKFVSCLDFITEPIFFQFCLSLSFYICFWVYHPLFVCKQCSFFAGIVIKRSVLWEGWSIGLWLFWSIPYVEFGSINCNIHIGKITSLIVITQIFHAQSHTLSNTNESTGNQWSGCVCLTVYLKLDNKVE